MLMNQTKDYSDVNKMKYNIRITLMVGTSAGEIKVPLSVVEKAKNRECFKLVDGASPPLPYKTKQMLSLIKKLYYGGF